MSIEQNTNLTFIYILKGKKKDVASPVQNGSNKPGHNHCSLD